MSGTECSTLIIDEYNVPLCAFSRSYDGYMEGHGKELVEFLENMTIQDGVSYKKDIANGMSCLAAQIIGHFKFFKNTHNDNRFHDVPGASATPAGSYYMIPVDVHKEYDWRYTVYIKSDQLYLKVENGDKIILDKAVNKIKLT